VRTRWQVDLRLGAAPLAKDEAIVRVREPFLSSASHFSNRGVSSLTPTILTAPSMTLRTSEITVGANCTVCCSRARCGALGSRMNQSEPRWTDHGIGIVSLMVLPA
jgi:hypothetical protein